MTSSKILFPNTVTVWDTVKTSTYEFQRETTQVSTLRHGQWKPIKKKKEQKVVRLKPHILDITMRVNK